MAIWGCFTAVCHFYLIAFRQEKLCQVWSILKHTHTHVWERFSELRENPSLSDPNEYKQNNGCFLPNYIRNPTVLNTNAWSNTLMLTHRLFFGNPASLRSSSGQACWVNSHFYWAMITWAGWDLHFTQHIQILHWTISNGIFTDYIILPDLASVKHFCVYLSYYSKRRRGSSIFLLDRMGHKPVAIRIWNDLIKSVSECLT